MLLYAHEHFPHRVLLAAVMIPPYPALSTSKTKGFPLGGSMVAPLLQNSGARIAPRDEQSILLPSLKKIQVIWRYLHQ